MTWYELKQKAKELGADVFDKFIVFSGLYFGKDGDILFFGDKIAWDRTPSQMWQIMEALR